MLDSIAMYVFPNRKKPAKTHILFAHNNANFDSYFIIPWLINNGFIQVIENDMLTEKTFYLLASDLNKNLRLEFVYRGARFILKDSIRFLNLPIKSLGKMLGMDKLEAKEFYGNSITDLSPEDQELYLEYAKRDTEILIAGIKMYADRYPSILFETTHTQATISLKSWRDSCSKEVKEYEHLLPEENRTRRHYFGGFTTVNEKYVNQIVENVYYYDINSSYPAIMLKPVAVRQITKEEAYKHPSTCLYKVFIKKATIKPNCVPIIRLLTSIKGSEGELLRTIIFAKEYKGTHLFLSFWQEEWEYVLKWYDIEYEIVDTIYFKKRVIFGYYINEYRQKKEYATKKLAEDLSPKEKTFYMFEKQLAKLFSNSLYGKFGAKGMYSNHFYISGNYNFESGDIVAICGVPCYIVNKRNPHYRGVECYNIIRIPERDKWVKSCNKNHFISSYITMKGRIALYRMIEKIGYDNFVYCDTDSIISKVPFDNSEIDNAEYGKWKLEGQFKYFKALRSKCYICSNNLQLGEEGDKKLVISGIKNPNFIVDRNLHLNDFNDTLETTQIAFINKNGGKGTIERIKKVIKN